MAARRCGRRCWVASLPHSDVSLPRDSSSAEDSLLTLHEPAGARPTPGWGSAALLRISVSLLKMPISGPAAVPAAAQALACDRCTTQLLKMLFQGPQKPSKGSALMPVGSVRLQCQSSPRRLLVTFGIMTIRLLLQVHSARACATRPRRRLAACQGREASKRQVAAQRLVGADQHPRLFAAAVASPADS